MQKKLLMIVMALSIIAVLDTVYLTYLHFSDTKAVCDISEKFSCEIVNKSSYSELGGIPISLLGLIVSLSIFLLTFCGLRKKKAFGFHPLRLAITLLIGSLFFAGYLYFVQAFLLLVYCLFCLLFDFLLVLMLGLIVFNEVKS